MSQYLYYALFEAEDDRYNVSFPDLPGCLTFGENMADALYMAKDALEGHLLVQEDLQNPIPAPSKPMDITVPINTLLIPIQVNTELARIKEENKYIKKTLTIPRYLNVLGERKGINFSQVLQDALKKHLLER